MILPGRIVSFQRIKASETGKTTFALKDEKEESFAVNEDGNEASATPRKEEEDDTILEVIEKLEDPGRLELQVKIGETTFENCLCDLGATVNLMNKATAEVLGMTTYAPSSMTLKFADHSAKAPVGTLEDVQVKVGESCVPTDFVVLDAGDLTKDPIILGRPFLNTAGAKINVQESQVELHLAENPEIKIKEEESKRLEETVKTVKVELNPTQDLEKEDKKELSDKEETRDEGEKVRDETNTNEITEQDEKPPDITKVDGGSKRRRRRKKTTKKPPENVPTQTFKGATLKELRRVKQSKDQQVGKPPTWVPVPDRGQNYTTRGRKKKDLDP